MNSVECDWCLQPAPASACGNCRQTFYCGTECQAAHWPFHQSECGLRLVDEGKYTLVRAKVLAQVGWYRTVKKTSPPFSLLVQQHTIAVLEGDDEMVVDNAWTWSMAWPDQKVATGVVKQVHLEPTTFERGKQTNHSYQQKKEYESKHVRDLWYPLLLKHCQRTLETRLQVDAQVRNFFDLVTPLKAYNQKQLSKVKAMWLEHTRLVDRAKKEKDDGQYYKQAVAALKQADQLGRKMEKMLKK